MISASDELVAEKIQEITGGEKQILILDLDNTILHARQVPLNFSIEKYYEPRKIASREEYRLWAEKKLGENYSEQSVDEEYDVKAAKMGKLNKYLAKMKLHDKLEDYIEVCRSKNSKYLVRKRPYLNEFLE
jgi:hypothetical protein